MCYRTFNEIHVTRQQDFCACINRGPQNRAIFNIADFSFVSINIDRNGYDINCEQSLGDETLKITNTRRKFAVGYTPKFFKGLFANQALIGW